MPKKSCVRCGSERLDEAGMAGYEPQLISKKAKNSLGTLLLPGLAPSRAEVCLDCGFVSFFVDVAKYRKRLKSDPMKRSV